MCISLWTTPAEDREGEIKEKWSKLLLLPCPLSPPQSHSSLTIIQLCAGMMMILIPSYSISPPPAVIITIIGSFLRSSGARDKGRRRQKTTPFGVEVVGCGRKSTGEGNQSIMLPQRWRRHGSTNYILSLSAGRGAPAGYQSSLCVMIPAAVSFLL